MFCSKCGKQVDEGNCFCMHCGNPLQTQDAHPVVQRTKETKNSGRRVLVIGILAGIVVLAVLIAVLTGFLPKGKDASEGPALTTTNAVRNTFAQGNFTVEFSLNRDDTYIEGIAFVDVDMEGKTLNLLAELEVKNVEIVLAIYDEYLLLSGYGLYQCKDISETLETFFDTCEQLALMEPDWKSVLNDLNILSNDAAAEYIDWIQLNRCMDAYCRRLNDPRWLKKNAGYSLRTENGVEKHILDPDMEEFVRASAPYFKDVLIGTEDTTKVLDILGKNTDQLKKIDIYAVFGIKDGYLVSYESKTSISGKKTGIEVEFTHIGTTLLDVYELEAMLEKAQKMPWS